MTPRGVLIIYPGGRSGLSYCPFPEPKDFESRLNEAESSIELGKLLEKTERITEAKSYLDFANNFFENINGRKITAGLVKQSL